MARNVADFMEEIFNGVGGVSGINDRLDNKLDKTANAVSASKLQTARSMKVSLASTAAANFDGSANVTVGVDGILPASHGGTGVSNLQNLNVGFATTASVAATSNFATRADQDCDGNKISTKYLTKTAADGYYLGKSAKAASATSADSATNAANDGSGRNIVNTYLTKTDAANTYLGKSAKAASATSADSATNASNDGSGNNIASTYAKKSDIPDTSKMMTTDTAQTIISGDKLFFSSLKFGSGNMVETSDAYRTFIYQRANVSGNLFFSIVGPATPGGNVNIAPAINFADGAAPVTLKSANVTYEFKSDGIYLNGTRITNSN